MNWLIFIGSTLACFRLTRLITDDKITDWLRRDVSKAGKKAKEGIHCPFCVSFYWAVFITLYLAVFYLTWQILPVYCTAVWGGSIIWNQIFVKLSK